MGVIIKTITNTVTKVPDYVQSAPRKLFTDPEGFIRGVIVRFILGGIIGLTLNVAGIIETVFGTIETAFTSAFGPLAPAAASVGGALYGIANGINGLLATIAGVFGPLAPAIYALEYLAIAWLLVRIGTAYLDVLQDLVGAIPVIGSVLSGLLAGIESLLTGDA